MTDHANDRARFDLLDAELCAFGRRLEQRGDTSRVDQARMAWEDAVEALLVEAELKKGEREHA